MLIKLDIKDFLELLVERIEYFTDDENIIGLFKVMYSNLINAGCFLENEAIDIAELVDNDYFNYCHVIDSDNENYGKIKALYEEGEYDISCEELDCNFIEAEYNGLFLVS